MMDPLELQKLLSNGASAIVPQVQHILQVSLLAQNCKLTMSPSFDLPECVEFVNERLKPEEFFHSIVVGPNGRCRVLYWSQK